MFYFVTRHSDGTIWYISVIQNRSREMREITILFSIWKDYLTYINAISTFLQFDVT